MAERRINMRDIDSFSIGDLTLRQERDRDTRIGQIRKRLFKEKRERDVFEKMCTNYSKAIVACVLVENTNTPNINFSCA